MTDSIIRQIVKHNSAKLCHCHIYASASRSDWSRDSIVAALTKCSVLESVRLIGCVFDSDQFQLLSDTPNRLTELYVKQAKGLNTTVLLNWLEHSMELKSFSIVDCEVDMVIYVKQVVRMFMFMMNTTNNFTNLICCNRSDLGSL